MYSQRILELERNNRGSNSALYVTFVALIFLVAVWEVPNTDITSLQTRRPSIAVGKRAQFKRKYPK